MPGVQSGKFVRGHWGLECYAHASLTNTVYTYKNLKQSIQPQVTETGRMTRLAASVTPRLLDTKPGEGLV